MLNMFSLIDIYIYICQRNDAFELSNDSFLLKKKKKKEDLTPDKICVSIFVSPSSLVTCNMQYKERKITK